MGHDGSQGGMEQGKEGSRGVAGQGGGHGTGRGGWSGMADGLGRPRRLLDIPTHRLYTSLPLTAPAAAAATVTSLVATVLLLWTPLTRYF